MPRPDGQGIREGLSSTRPGDDTGEEHGTIGLHGVPEKQTKLPGRFAYRFSRRYGFELINYVRSADGEKLLARASVISAGRRHAACRCDVFAAGPETLCAAAQGAIVATASPEGAR